MEDVYRHMRTVPLETADEGTTGVPAGLTPQFSLAFLRQAKDPALLLTPDGRVSFLNAAACDLFGLETVEAVNGRLLWELWSDPEAAPVFEHATESARGGEAVRFPAITEAHGDERRLTITLSPVIDNDGRIASLFCLAQAA